MCNSKEQLRDNILMGMQIHIDSQTMQILDNVIIQCMQNVNVTQIETLPATIDNTNEYVISLFKMKKSNKLSDETVRYYLKTIRKLIDIIHKPLTMMTQLDLEVFQQYYINRGNTETSVNNQIRNASAFFTWMRKTKLISDNPCDGIEMLTQIEKPIDHLEPNEWERLKTGCKYPRDRAMLEFFRCTAMRKGELPILRIKDLNWNKGPTIIYGQKGKKFRPVGLDDVALEYLKEYIKSRGLTIDSEEALFVSVRGHKTLAKGGIYAAIKAIAKRSGLERNVYPHLIRKTVATNIVRRGGAVSDAGEYLGHAERSTAGRHYAYKSEGHTMKIFNELVAAV